MIMVNSDLDRDIPMLTQKKNFNNHNKKRKRNNSKDKHNPTKSKTTLVSNRRKILTKKKITRMYLKVPLQRK